MYAKNENMYPGDHSKHNLNCEKQVLYSMISNGEGWRYIAVEKLPALLKRVTSKHNSDFYCLNCLHFFAKENKDESHKKVCEICF